MGYKVAVAGATGNVGREILKILAEREFPADEVVALASGRSAGREVSFGEDQTLKIQDMSKFDFKGVDIVLSSPGGEVSAVIAKCPASSTCLSLLVDGAFMPGLRRLWQRWRWIRGGRRRRAAHRRSGKRVRVPGRH